MNRWTAAAYTEVAAASAPGLKCFGSPDRGLRTRTWLERHAHTIAFAILLALAVALLLNGIVGLTS